MKKYDKEWNEINTLLSFLTGGSKNAIQLYDSYYLYLYNNDAPGLLLQHQIEIVQKLLDEAE